MNSRNIVFFHALNDNSGSPKILSLIIRGLLEKGYTVDLFTSSLNGGFLSGIPGVKYHKIFYRFSENRILTSFLFVVAQIRYFFSSLKYIGSKNVIFYINTIIPFGATLGGYVFRIKSICHVHENPVRKNIVHRIELFVLRKFPSKAIFVSKYLYDSYIMAETRKELVSNALYPGFVEIAEKHTPVFKNPGNILMACSLKVYKGIFVFLELAELLPEFSFTLILNAGMNDIASYFRGKKIPRNLDIVPARDNLILYYEKTQLVVNLSLPDLCVEAFGLTILEALTFGIPVIVPPAGGVAELVTDGFNGYKINAGDMKVLTDRIVNIFSNESLYYKMSANAKLSSKKYDYTKMIDSIDRILSTN